jgi:hypothetical protein
MTIVTARALRDPVVVSSRYTVEVTGSGGHYPQEIAQAALRHLRVWLMRDMSTEGEALNERVPPANVRDGLRNRTFRIRRLLGPSAP